MSEQILSRLGRDPSPLWNRALQRYRDELDENDDYNDISAEAGSMQDVLDYAKTFENSQPRKRATLNSLNRVGPMLKFINNFSTVIAVYYGADTRLTAFVWGSIRLILVLASSAGDTLRDVVDMLEELSLTLPKFRNYEQNLPMDEALESSLVDVYTEVICFYARAIQFFRSHPQDILLQKAWNDLQVDFTHTLKRIRRLSQLVEIEAELARMRLNTGKNSEVLDLMEDLKDSKISTDMNIVQCYQVPHEATPRFWGRDTALQEVASVLRPDSDGGGLRTFALYGMGGVGKTQIALRYIEKHRSSYDSVLWISADTEIGMDQSITGIVQALKLIGSKDELQDTFGAMVKFKNWLRESHGHWLLVFDNADVPDLLNQIWPNSANGSILITSRDSAVASHPASAGFHVKPFDYGSGSQVLLQLLSLDTTKTNSADATAIAEILGGLPLALNQIASFISQRKLSLHDFLPLYKEHFEKIDMKKSRLTPYDHTLSTVWEMSLSRLSGFSAHLQKLLALFHPDGLNENVLREGSKFVTDNDFEFLSDDMDLSDAEEILLRAALIDKIAEHRTIRVHRLIQSAVLRRLSNQDRTKYFDAAVQILHYGFGETWDEDSGDLYKPWTEKAWFSQERCLPHVIHLTRPSHGYKLTAGNPQKYGELLRRCASYLYQKEYFDVAISLLDVALKQFGDGNKLSFARATNLRGLILLNLHEPEKAIEPFNEALRIRQTLLPVDDPLIAWGYNNLGMVYTELCKFDLALTNHEKAVELRLSGDPERIGTSYSNLSSLYLRMGKVKEAEEYLYKCPKLKDFTDDTFLQTHNPRFAGDMVLLSRIRKAQGRLEDAMRLATKALAFRRKLLGNRLTTCDAQYYVADLLHKNGNSSSAVATLESLIEAAESLPGGEGQAARANYKLAILYANMDRKNQSDQYWKRAVIMRMKLRPEEENTSLDVQYNVPNLLHRDGNSSSAVATLERPIEAVESLPGGESDVARLNDELAIDMKRKLRLEEDGASFDEDGFMDLCPWMLW